MNIFGQMWLMDVFFGGQFTLYGLEVDCMPLKALMLQTEILFKVVRLTGKNIEERVDPMARVFPKMTKCTFHK